MGEVLQPDRPPIGVGEHRTTPPPARPGSDAGVAAPLLGELVPEQLDRLPHGLVDQPPGAGLVQGDGPDTGAALRRPAVQLPWQRDELPGDGQLAGLGVQVVAFQGGGLAPAQAAQRDQPPQRRQPVVLHSGQEGDQLPQRPHRNWWSDAVPPPSRYALIGPDDGMRSYWLVEPDLRERVAGNEALTDGGVQR
jgi:hypothetical protein